MADRLLQNAASALQGNLVRWPAEWEPHQGTFFTWPHNRDTWVEDHVALEAAFVQAIMALAIGETVHVTVPNEQVEAHAHRCLAQVIASGSVLLHRVPTNDSWCRDYGPIFVHWGRGLTAIDFRFNAWGGKYPPWDFDDSAAPLMASQLGVGCLSNGLVLEGGAIEGNGNGLLLTTEQCLLHPTRNPQLSLTDIEMELRAALGVHDLIWLGDGVAGDDTDGHIDNLARFVAADTVLAATEPDRRRPNHLPLADNLERLRTYRDANGKRLRVLELPLPEPVLYGGRELPASYANFYIGNSVVLMPSYGATEREAEAQRTLAELFPSRTVVPVDCRVVVRGFGAWHCLTQQIPKPPII